MEADEHHVFFAVVGFTEHPRQISLITGVEADDFWVEGETFTDVMPEARRRENRWILSSGLNRDASHRDHFERLLYKLYPLADRLPRLMEDYRCGIGVSRFFFMDDPRFYLPEELIASFHELGLDVGFDQLVPSAAGGLPEVDDEILNLPDEDDW
jgi:hypothetical protein